MRINFDHALHHDSGRPSGRRGQCRRQLRQYARNLAKIPPLLSWAGHRVATHIDRRPDMCNPKPLRRTLRKRKSEWPPGNPRLRTQSSISSRRHPARLAAQAPDGIHPLIQPVLAAKHCLQRFPRTHVGGIGHPRCVVDIYWRKSRRLHPGYTLLP